MFKELCISHRWGYLRITLACHITVHDFEEVCDNLNTPLKVKTVWGDGVPYVYLFAQDDNPQPALEFYRLLLTSLSEHGLNVYPAEVEDTEWPNKAVLEADGLLIRRTATEPNTPQHRRINNDD